MEKTFTHKCYKRQIAIVFYTSLCYMHTFWLKHKSFTDTDWSDNSHFAVDDLVRMEGVREVFKFNFAPC